MKGGLVTSGSAIIRLGRSGSFRRTPTLHRHYFNGVIQRSVQTTACTTRPSDHPLERERYGFDDGEKEKKKGTKSRSDVPFIRLFQVRKENSLFRAYVYMTTLRQTENASFWKHLVTLWLGLHGNMGEIFENVRTQDSWTTATVSRWNFLTFCKCFDVLLHILMTLSPFSWSF